MKRHTSKLVYLIWIVAPVLFVGTYFIVGMPHFHFNYKYKPSSQISSGRWKTACSYIGANGEFWMNANSNGTCDWFIFRKNQGGRNSG